MKIKDYIIIVLVIISLSISIWNALEKPKIGFVRSLDLIEKYKGMEDGRLLYQKKHDSWQLNIDSLKNAVQLKINIYQESSVSMSENEKTLNEQIIRGMQQTLYEYSKEVEEKAQIEDQRITQGVLNQINSYIEDYGKENGYTVIFGTTMDGTLLYGESMIDITEVILKELNKNYTGIE